MAPEVAEAALAHTVANKVEAAYRRSDLFEKRRALMQQWGSFCVPDNAGDGCTPEGAAYIQVATSKGVLDASGYDPGVIL